ncbi:GNAT family N-acetyltransferase [Clostridium sp. 'deep sea']|uniref:GNAT family N-acetyltransferase n=1 Tax=Clostridium sp. 'deep sea' TaxID=2779445 RepID=UPI0018968DB2|nr:GNAT family N-acetyltransferase [Clostridium sp. 'deep sea']QOR36767.1 GNAT family N-acetyltransferase [Clostridium sp. 'deep sea']
MNKIRIRQVTMADLDTVTKIEAICFPATEKASKDSFKQRISTFPRGFWLAELNNEIIGFINGAASNKTTIEDEFFSDMSLHCDNGENIAIFGLDVLPQYQRNGYAAQLIKHYIKIAKEDNRKKVLLTCKKHLVHYYTKFGFNNCGVSQSVHGGAQWFDMELNLVSLTNSSV